MMRRDVMAAATVLGLTIQLVSGGAASAQTKPAAAPKAINVGDILSGQLNAIRSRGKAKARGKRMPVYQLVSEPRRLPPPGGLCNLETGPETFQIVTATDAQSAQLKPLIGKAVALKVEEISCAEEAGVVSEAMVTKWTLAR